MPTRLLIFLVCSCLPLLTANVCAQTSPPSTQTMLTRFGAAPNGLARHDYLSSVLPSLDGNDKSLARQLLATVDSELGLYNEAVITFPFDNRIAPSKTLPLPITPAWHAVDAADTIAALSAQRHIVMVNEAHHDAHTRQLTLALLPRLYAQGYRYFAAEAIVPSDTGLSHRGYPTDISGSEYLQEPLYGEIVRQAIRLGYTIVAYDSDANPTANRETEQAKNIYKAVFAKDPQARLFIHAGYSHIDKAPGNLGDDIKPMAMQLKKLSGFDPLTVDQTQFRQIAIGMIDFGTYSTLAQRFSPEVPVVLRNTDTGEIWSANLLQHDMSVILPPARAQDMKSESQLDMDVSRREAHLSTNAYEADVRPSWLSLDGQRIALRIDTELCEQQVPCVIDAHYPGEPDNAVPADRYTFLHAHSGNVLYLYPGHYRLRAWRSDGSTVGQREVDVKKPQ